MVMMMVIHSYLPAFLGTLTPLLGAFYLPTVYRPGTTILGSIIPTYPQTGQPPGRTTIPIPVVSDQ